MSANNETTGPAELGVFPSVAEARSAGKSCLVLRRTEFLKALADPEVQDTLARVRAISDASEDSPLDARELNP